MHRPSTPSALLSLVVASTALGADSISDLERQFADPPVDYRIMMLLRTNDEVDREQLGWQIRSMREQGCGGAFSYAERFQGGAPEAFLSEWWWKVVRWTAEACAKEGLQYWAYDEEDWPSGAAGGKLLEKHPEFLWKYLKVVEHRVDGAAIDVPVGPHIFVVALAYQADGERVRMETIRDLGGSVREGRVQWQPPGGAWTVAIYTAVPEKVGWQNRSYPDLMDKQACAKFVDWVYRGHLEEVQKVPGAKLHGFFLDEPSMTLAAYPAGSIFSWHPAMPYTPALPERFKQLYGQDWHLRLPLLYHEGGPETVQFRIRHWEACCSLYSDNFFGQIYDFCDRHGLKSSGHLHVEEDHRAHLTLQGGNLLAHFRRMHIPGIDWIHPFENPLPAVVPKYAASMAHLLGRERTWCESFAASGWGVTLQQLRRLIDWQHVNGINMQIPISYKHSLRQPNRATFYNPGISYQQPWWDHFRAFADYEARMCLLASGGGHVAQIALAYPDTDMRAHCWELQLVHERGLEYNRLGDELRFAGYDFDVLDDESILKHAQVEGGALRTKTESFPILVFPRIDAVRRATVERALELARSGGTVLFIGRVPTHSIENGANDPELARLIRELVGSACSQPAEQNPHWQRHGTGRAGFARSVEVGVSMLREMIRPDLVLPEGTRDVCAYHRRFADGDLYLVLNRRPEPRTLDFTVSAQGHAERWSAQTGRVEAVGAYEITPAGTRVSMDFGPDELVPLFLRHEKPSKPPASRPSRVVREMPIEEPFEFRAEETLTRPELAWNFSQEKDGWKSATRPAVPAQMASGDWSEKLPHFSGLGHYTTTITLDERPARGRVQVDLGKVAVTAEVIVNGKRAGLSVFEPHVVDITDHVKPGANRLEIVVANTLANYYAQFAELKEKPVSLGGIRPGSTVSGLIGPVRVQFVE